MGVRAADYRLVNLAWSEPGRLRISVVQIRIPLKAIETKVCRFPMCIWEHGQDGQEPEPREIPGPEGRGFAGPRASAVLRTARYPPRPKGAGFPP